MFLSILASQDSNILARIISNQLVLHVPLGNEVRRPGLSELLAVVVLLAVTLTVGVLLYIYLNQPANVGSAASEAASVVNSAGGNPATEFYANAEVSASGVSCSVATGTCAIELTDTGSANAQANGCLFSGGGGTGLLSPNPATLTAGGSVQVTCTIQSAAGRSSGSQVAGSIILSNGATVPWVGNWQ